MKEKTLTEFTAELSSGKPVPGGGGAAALCGALAASLGDMVLNYTTGKKKYADVEDKVQALLARVTEIREEFLQLIEDDAKAFEPLSKAYKVSADDPTRGDLLEAATLSAIIPPLNMAVLAQELSGLITEVYLLGNKMLNSDAACAASLCKSAMECAAVNVFVNTKTLIDRDTAESVNEEVIRSLKAVRQNFVRVFEDYTGGVAE